MATKTKWAVQFESRKAEKAYIDLFKKGKISKEDNNVISKWVQIIENQGLEIMQQMPKWDDHGLDDNWKGFRSSSFSKSGRIIYKIVDDKLMVSVVRITPDHNYKR